MRKGKNLIRPPLTLRLFSRLMAYGKIKTKGAMIVEKKKYTNVHIGPGFSVKSKFKVAVTYEQAREHGRKEVEKNSYLHYLGVMGVDITQKELNKVLSTSEIGEGVKQ